MASGFRVLFYSFLFLAALMRDLIFRHLADWTNFYFAHSGVSLYRTLVRRYASMEARYLLLVKF